MVENNLKYNPTDTVVVINNFPGVLAYKSSTTGLSLVWSEKGSTQFMSIQELQNMRNNSIAFFENNWIVIEDADADNIYKFLGVSNYYNTDVFQTPGDYTELYKMSYKKMKDVISKMSPGVKESVAIDVTNKIKEGKIDSLKKITQLSELLDRQFI